jgi:hypothetical protein
MNKPTEIEEDFPFDEIRTESGDYFDSIDQVRAAGYADNQIWSVTEHDNTWCYGPSHHWVNLIGYIATKETHDGNTYYFDHLSDYSDDPGEAAEWHSFDPDC